VSKFWEAVLLLQWMSEPMELFIESIFSVSILELHIE